MKPQEHFHGSDLEKIESIYGIKREDIIGFSANVNPLGISKKLKTAIADRVDAITEYPDREYTLLRREIAAYIEGDMNSILVGNGATELISLFIQIIHPKKALLVAPTYSEYEREISLQGGVCESYELKERDNFCLDTLDLSRYLTDDLDLLVICNPNNPTSTAISIRQMEEILNLCKKKNIFCMVDETYVEFVKDVANITSCSLVSSHDNLIILRGTSKFFAAPGLRLGYAICGNQELVEYVNKRKNPWTINTLAAIAGEIMFSDEEYIRETRNLIDRERDYAFGVLSSCKNIKVYTPSANFVLIKILKEGLTSDMVFDAAIKKGFMIRDCSSFEFLDNRFIRFCFMMPEANRKLLDLLLELLD